MGTLESRIDNLEDGRNALEWMVVFLAKKLLMRESEPVAAAEAMQVEIEEFGQGFVAHAFQSGRDDDLPMRAVRLTSEISILAERITEEVKNQVATS